MMSILVSGTYRCTLIELVGGSETVKVVKKHQKIVTILQ